MPSQLNYEETLEFKKDWKRLQKKFSSISDDFALVKKAAIELFHLHGLNNLSIFPIPHFCGKEIQVCKVKKFACKSLKGRGAKSGIRLVYAFHVNLSKVVLIEIYFKGDQENEDQMRIKHYLKSQL
ncbi:MAG: hypothetical protein G01um101418_738 [Parcubacteria group bacterium Gr01-1014_18]|nr:MAG: hypothetical protein Greene041636_728 [Parcubacteria group bacterium Greene0416_36]TSC80230.1 MAG: hypothetical protein G01um101418_738 [Parcubacteria group bacterium Gr01-1014_18]TSC98412.1 MAG: hypothetical protein Greene101420_765 [Parcubacteria group bacterium Greene1014_20]TSD06953.1 MAG: hypothetical protein Greene07142_516 [Parcubacteria group bacterium Greene0714_2]